jgi:serine/threonine protein phosphatase PrpC
MEDCSKSIDKFTGDSNIGFFSLYDGHGGKETSNYIKDRIPELLEEKIKQNKQNNINYEKLLTESFEKCDEDLKMKFWSDYSGSTACVVLTIKEGSSNNNLENISNDNSKYTIYSANAGDSRTVLLNPDKNYVKRLSYDHKATDPSEIARLRKSGGAVFNGRVFGTLAVSRAFGDFELKRFGITATPYITKTVTNKGDKYIVIASDGVWDVLTDDDVLSISKKFGSNANELSDAILHISLDRGSLDNISVLVVSLY